ncbi:MAG: class I tRNA ligase family protein, partial [Candidatus Omnitrophica bacterium]|nr:class I tRNA ligase family protein [Candidatus Omnitrophota bacterium]
EALTGKPFAKYWIHHGLLTINGQKMAKSLGNFVTIKDFISKYKYADFLKLFFLSAHYSSPIDYTEEKIEEAKQALGRISILLGKIGSHKPGKAIPEIEDIKNNFIQALDDDFNTPEALATVFELVNLTNKNIDNPDFAYQGKKTLKDLLSLLGLSLKFNGAQDNTKIIQDLIDKRISLKKEKKFSEADKIRKDLEAKGIILEDAKDGKTTWRRKL